MKSFTGAVAALAVVVGLGMTSAALADVSPCSKPTGWFSHAKGNDCKGLSHYYHCHTYVKHFCSGKVVMYTDIKKIYHHGKYVANQKADKKAAFKPGLTPAEACAKLYKMDF